MKKLTRLFCILMALALAACALFSCGNTNYAADNTEIVIGMTGPLTGGASIYGIAVRNAAQMAVDEINAAGGLDGIKFKFVMQDDAHDSSRIPSAYANLYEGGMQISLGTVTTDPGKEFAKLSKEDNVFFLTPSASGDSIPQEANGYQMCFADSNQGAAAARVVNSDYADKKVGVLYNTGDTYSTGILAQFEANLNADIKANLVKASFDEAKPADLSSQVNLLKDCEFIFMPIYYTPASLFMTQALNVENNIKIYYGCDGLDGIDSIDGFDIAAIPQEISMLTHFNSGVTEGPAYEFIQRYKARYNETPIQFAASAYDCVYAIFQALKTAKAAGTEITATMSPSDFCKILQDQFKTMVFTGVTGEYKDGKQTTISWDENGFVNKTATKAVVKEADTAQ